MIKTAWLNLGNCFWFYAEHQCIQYTTHARCLPCVYTGLQQYLQAPIHCQSTIFAVFIHACSNILQAPIHCWTTVRTANAQMHDYCRVFIQACSNICNCWTTVRTANAQMHDSCRVFIHACSNICRHQFTAERQCVQQMHKCMILAVCLYTLAVIFASTFSLPKRTCIADWGFGAECMHRVGRNYIYTVYIRFSWQGNHQIYSHIRCIITVLAKPMHG